MPASAPLILIPPTVTSLANPTFLSAKVAVVFAISITSDPNLLLVSVPTTAVVLPSYTLSNAVGVIVKLLTVILAVPLAVELVNV